MLKTLHQKLKQEQKILSEKINQIKKNRTKTFILVAIFICTALIGWGIANALVIATGKSLDKTLFVKSFSRELKEGDYVVVISDPNDPIAKGRYLTKKVFCTPGNILKIKGDDYYCNEFFIGSAKHKTKTGLPVKPFNPCESNSNNKVSINMQRAFDGSGESYCVVKVPNKYYFVAGTHKDSYDSRYFGFIPHEKILCKVIPII